MKHEVPYCLYVLLSANVYNIPICIWVMDSHPYNPPMVYVKPTSTMQIKEGRNVDRNGKIDLPYLREWKYVSVLCLKCFIWSFFNTLALKDYKHFTLNTCWYKANCLFLARLFLWFLDCHYFCRALYMWWRTWSFSRYIITLLLVFAMSEITLSVMCYFIWTESTCE